MPEPRAAVILAAGQGVRMKSARPKVLHAVGGKAMLAWATDLAKALGAERTAVVAGAGATEVAEAARALGAEVRTQDAPKGTGHAVLAARASLEGFKGRAVVLFADTPLIRPATVEAAFAALDDGAGVAVLGFEAQDPNAYGRLVVSKGDMVERIVEARDATPDQLKITLCNSGVLAADASLLLELLGEVNSNNAKGEYYLTDVVALARKRGLKTAVVRGEEREFLGVNDRAGLARAEAEFQARARAEALAGGATLLAPETVFFSHDTDLAPDVTVEPNVFFGLGVKVAQGAIIRAFSHFTRARIGPGAEVGPFARLRPGADIRAKAKVGNFVELKNTVLGEGAKASHLTYLGDADVGARANIGAGTITCNYDGFSKHRTVIGEGAFIGSDTALVAPVSVGAGAYTGAGSVITQDISDDALAVSRGRQRELPGWAARFRAKHKKDAAE